MPEARRRAGRSDTQRELGLDAGETGGPRYGENAIVNEIRSQLKVWRAIPNPSDWGVTPTTARLLQHWRDHD